MDPAAKKRALRLLSNGMYVMTSQGGVASGAATVHILGDDQQDVARRFFSPTRADGAAINGEPCRPGTTSAPILDVAPAYVECQVREIVDCGGDHAAAVMEVVEAQCRRPVRPLTIAESPWEYGG